MQATAGDGLVWSAITTTNAKRLRRIPAARAPQKITMRAVIPWPASSIVIATSRVQLPHVLLGFHELKSANVAPGSYRREKPRPACNYYSTFSPCDSAFSAGGFSHLLARRECHGSLQRWRVLDKEVRQLPAERWRRAPALSKAHAQQQDLPQVIVPRSPQS